MANWCSVEAEIVCFDGQEAETLYQKLLTDKTEANKFDRGVYIGSDRYFFNSIIEVNGDTVTLNGSVKWGFTDDEILEFIRHLKSVVPIKSAEIKYEETGCFIYGYFSYEDRILYDTYLPESCFPDYDEETYYEQLEQLLSTNSQTKIICQI
ncbi:MAG: hypothetical protein IKA22_06410 [Lentisphaeria bacterium]|nr:hypothetical protein [Lentisphaeria bacterium]